MKKDLKSLKNRKSLVTFGMGVVAVGVVSAAIAIPLTTGKKKQIDNEDYKHKVGIGTKTFLSRGLANVSKDIQKQYPLAKEGTIEEVDQTKDDVSFKYIIKDGSHDLQLLEDAINGVSSDEESDEAIPSALGSDVTFTFGKESGKLEQVIANFGPRDKLVLKIVDGKDIITFNNQILSGKAYGVALNLLAPKIEGDHFSGIIGSKVVQSALSDKTPYVAPIQESVIGAAIGETINVDASEIKDNVIEVLPASLINKNDIINKRKEIIPKQVKIPKTQVNQEGVDWHEVDKSLIIDTPQDTSIPWSDIDKKTLINLGSNWLRADPSKVIKVPVYKDVKTYSYGNKQYDTLKQAQEALIIDVHKQQVYIVNGKEFVSKDKAIKEWLSLDTQVSAIVGDSFISKIDKPYNGMPLSDLLKLNQGVKGYTYGDKVYPSVDLAKAAWFKEWSVKKKLPVEGLLKVSINYQGSTGTTLIPYDAVPGGFTPDATKVLSENHFTWDTGKSIDATGRVEYTLYLGKKEILKYTPPVGKGVKGIVSDQIHVEVDKLASLEQNYVLSDAPDMGAPKLYISKPADQGSTGLKELKKENLIRGYVYDSKFYLDKESAQAALVKSFAIALSDSEHEILVGKSVKAYSSIDQAYSSLIQEVTSQVEVEEGVDEDVEGIY